LCSKSLLLIKNKEEFYVKRIRGTKNYFLLSTFHFFLLFLTFSVLKELQTMNDEKETTSSQGSSQTPMITCIFPNCNETQRTRGLCSRHYAMARTLIAEGRVTEEQLVNSGKMNKAARQSAAEDAKWFTS